VRCRQRRRSASPSWANIAAGTPTWDGIFLDETSTNCVHEPYYATVDVYVKSRRFSIRESHF